MTTHSEDSGARLVARHAPTGNSLTIGDVPLERLRVYSERGELRCPSCGGLLRFGRCTSASFCARQLGAMRCALR